MTWTWRLVVTAAFVGLSLTSAWGQIEVRCTLAQNSVLQFERVEATVAIYNVSGGYMVFGGPEANSHLSFRVERSSGVVVPPNRDVTWPSPVRLASGEQSSRTFDLQRYFAIPEPGAYAVVAVVHWRGRTFRSQKLFFDVARGVEIDRLSLTPPSAPDALYTFSLRTLHRGAGDYALLRVDDETRDLCLGVYELGRILRVYRPTIQIDDFSHVHVLHQSGPNLFTHTVFTAQGLPISQNVHASGGAARLRKQPNGELIVSAPALRPAELGQLPEDALEGRASPWRRGRP